MSHTKRITQTGKNNTLVEQAKMCLANASKYCKDNDFQRVESALTGALNDLKSIKEHPDSQAVLDFKTKIRGIDAEVRQNRNSTAQFAERLSKMAEEVLTLAVAEEVPVGD